MTRAKPGGCLTNKMKRELEHTDCFKTIAQMELFQQLVLDDPYRAGSVGLRICMGSSVVCQHMQFIPQIVS